MKLTMLDEESIRAILGECAATPARTRAPARAQRSPPARTTGRLGGRARKCAAPRSVEHLPVSGPGARRRYRINSADVRINCDATPDDLIDVIEGNRVYMPCVYALNKIDAITMEELDVLDAVPHYCPISSHYKWNLDGLMDMVFEYLNMTRVYTKPKGQMPDYSAPVILRGIAEPTVETFCKKIHRTLITDFKYAWVWGASVKHNPGRVGKAHVLQDEDVIQSKRTAHCLPSSIMPWLLPLILTHGTLDSRRRSCQENLMRRPAWRPMPGVIADRARLCRSTLCGILL